MNERKVGETREAQKIEGNVGQSEEMRVKQKNYERNKFRKRKGM